MVESIHNTAVAGVRPKTLPREVSSTPKNYSHSWTSQPIKTLATATGIVGILVSLIGKLGDMDNVRTIGKDLAIAGFAVLGGLIIHALSGKADLSKKQQLPEEIPEWETPAEWEERQLDLENNWENHLFPNSSLSSREQRIFQNDSTKSPKHPKPDKKTS